MTHDDIDLERRIEGLKKYQRWCDRVMLIGVSVLILGVIGLFLTSCGGGGMEDIRYVPKILCEENPDAVALEEDGSPVTDDDGNELFCDQIGEYDE